MFYLTDATEKAFETALANHDKPEGTVVFEAFLEGKSPISLTINININRVGKTEGNWMKISRNHKTISVSYTFKITYLSILLSTSKYL
ncbi:hypothetical protein [Bacillus mycoides]|uniref:hypothetical protein n=1 Tax=Bacillus mycoides TaxID=1405 RepID=UPI002E23C37B|nr:hypothetical protein [Bacillus mycoides]